MGDLLAAVLDFNEKTRAMLNAESKGAFRKLTRSPGEAAPTEDELDAEYQESLRRNLSGRLEHIGMVRAAGDKPEKKEVVELLRDPLSSETRTTRRNVGALSVLAVTMGIVGEAPTKIPGIELAVGSHRWLFPVLLGVVLTYEFIAFRLYLKSDMTRRAILRDASQGYVAALQKGLIAMQTSMEAFLGMATKLSGDTALRDSIKDAWLALARSWNGERGRLEREMKVENSRRWWDENVPSLVYGAALLAVLVAGWRISNR
jgi:hypothetical protein